MYWPLNSSGFFNPVANRECINGCIKTVLSRKIKALLLPLTAEALVLLFIN